MPEASDIIAAKVAQALGLNKTEDTGGQGSDQGGNANNQSLGWRAALPAELRDVPEIASMQKPGELAKAYLEANAKLQKAIVPPGEGANDTELKAFRAKLGVPENPEGYEIDSSGDKEFGDVFRKAAHKEGLTPKQAKTLYQDIMNASKEIIARAQAQSKKARDTAAEKLKQEWGDRFEANDIAARRFAALAGAEMVDALGEKGLIDDPRVLKGLYRFANMISEDRIVDGRGSRRADTGWTFPNTPGM